MTPRHGEDTREALIDAALEVFLRRGFARATTREIAQTAGVAEGTIYRHFADKYALFHEVFLSLTGRGRRASCTGSAREPATEHGPRQPGVPVRAGRRHAGAAVVAHGVHVGRPGAGQEHRRPYARAGAARASSARAGGDGGRVHPGGAGAGQDQARRGRERRPRRWWCRSRSRPGWSARSARSSSRSDRRVPRAGAFPMPARGRSRHPRARAGPGDRPPSRLTGRPAAARSAPAEPDWRRRRGVA